MHIRSVGRGYRVKVLKPSLACVLFFPLCPRSPTSCTCDTRCGHFDCSVRFARGPRGMWLGPACSICAAILKSYIAPVGTPIEMLRIVWRCPVTARPPARPPPTQVFGRHPVRPIQIRDRCHSRKGAISWPCGSGGGLATDGTPWGKRRKKEKTGPKKRAESRTLSTPAPLSYLLPRSLVSGRGHTYLSHDPPPPPRSRNPTELSLGVPCDQFFLSLVNTQIDPRFVGKRNRFVYTNSMLGDAGFLNCVQSCDLQATGAAAWKTHVSGFSLRDDVVLKVMLAEESMSYDASVRSLECSDLRSFPG